VGKIAEGGIFNQLKGGQLGGRTPGLGGGGGLMEKIRWPQDQHEKEEGNRDVVLKECIEEEC